MQWHICRDADAGVMLWVGSHSIRRRSGAADMAEMAAVYLRPVGVLKAPSEPPVRACGAPSTRLRRVRYAAAIAAAARNSAWGSMPHPSAPLCRLQINPLDSPEGRQFR